MDMNVMMDLFKRTRRLFVNDLKSRLVISLTIGLYLMLDNETFTVFPRGVTRVVY